MNVEDRKYTEEPLRAALPTPRTPNLEILQSLRVSYRLKEGFRV